jgi:threonine dehydratase
MKVTLQDIQAAAALLKGVIRPTEVDKSYSATAKVPGTEVYFKLENTQFTGSFKLRGAYNKINALTPEEKKRGVVASSAGNHAQGVAFSAQKAGVKATIVMPVGAPLIKVEATRGYGAEVVFHGEVVDDSHVHARELVEKHNYVFVHPFEDEKVIAGQGTIGLEILQALPDLDSIIVPIGGGGLISGIATAVKAINPKCRVIGVQSAAADGMARMFHHETLGEPKRRISTIADGIAIKKPSQIMYDSFISKLVDEVVSVTDDEIAEAIVFCLERAKTVTEGAGAAGVAALMSRKLNLGKKTCVVLCGGNIDLNMIAKVIEKGQISKGRLCMLSVVVDDLPGTLNRLTQAIADLRANVLEVHHDRVNQGLFLRETRIDFVLETTGLEHINQIKNALTQAGGRILP